MPLANHTGQFRHVAYGDVFITIDCNDTASPAGPSAATGAGPCRLRMSRGPESQLSLAGNLEHKTGDFWLALAFFEHVPEVIQGCIRVQFRVDSRGIVTHVGADLRMEGEDGPLVWFERV